MPRKGFITASSFDNLMTNGKGSDTLGKTAIAECRKIAMAWHGVELPELDTPAIRWGIENEPLARETYESLNFTSVKIADFANIGPIGGTCDGLVGAAGMIEIKCPNSDNHLQNMMDGSYLSDYEWQVHGYIWLYNRQWCDFITFDPRFPVPETQIHVIRVVRDETKIQALKTRLDMCVPIIEQAYNLLESKRTA